MKPWREIAVPHGDVLKGTFQPAEFAADISAVHSGKAPVAYQDAKGQPPVLTRHEPETDSQDSLLCDLSKSVS